MAYTGTSNFLVKQPTPKRKWEDIFKAMNGVKKTFSPEFYIQ